MSKRDIGLGSVIIHARGQNPYRRDGIPNPCGEERAVLLRAFRDGVLPPEWAAWNDDDREEITDPATVDWTALFAP